MVSRTAISFVLISALFFTSCKKELVPQDNSETPLAQQTVAPTAVLAPQQAVAETSSMTAALNPAHGQPGHRCDIAVGAPLNSAPTPTQSQPQTTQQTTQMLNATPTQKQVVTAKGMNPPHGQPNHRCDIAVGAPLNSAPAKTTAAMPNGKASVQKIETGNNVPATLAAPSTETAVGMNPPHGQEGHRCDVAVGAPLPKG